MKFFCHFKLNIVFLISFSSFSFFHKSDAQTFDINVLKTHLIKSKSDSINWKTKYWSSVDLNQRFFIVDSAEFYRNQVLTLILNTRRYKPYTMSLKFYPHNDLKIKYKPTLVKKQLLFEERGYLDAMQHNTQYAKTIGDVFSFKKRNESFFIKNPYLVKYVLKTIPEPQRLISERKHLRNRSAKEGIKNLLVHNVFSTKKLDKIVKKNGPWIISGTENIQLSQTHLENWTKGGENSLALTSDLLIKANYTLKKNEWENYIRHKVGFINTESYDAQINSDQIEVNSKYGLKASKKWYYSFLFDFKSQFFNGYNNKEKEEITSGFLSPAYFTFAPGMDFKKNKNFTLLLSPLTSKITYVMDTVKVDQTNYQIKEDKKAAYNNGASLVNNLTWEISTELSLKSQLDAFIGYFTKDPITQIDWELIFDMRVNRFLSTRINTQLRYFTNESSKVQSREYFTINFNYKF